MFVNLNNQQKAHLNMFIFVILIHSTTIFIVSYKINNQNVSLLLN